MTTITHVSLVSATTALHYATTRRSSERGEARDLATLKILIVSPPKTGNTWVKQLLSTIYDLPIVHVGDTFDTTTINLDGLGPRWIAHQHWGPTPELIRWASTHGLLFVTPVRHPGDMLVSLYYYFRSYADDLRAAEVPVDLMNLDRTVLGDRIGGEKRVGKHLLWYVQDEFVDQFDMLFTWLRFPQALSVRYEDLWRDPAPTLKRLTDGIIPVSLDTIERAIEACDITIMRAMAGSGDKFFRRGGVGEWKTALPPEVIDVLRHVEPYPTYCAFLGYTFAPDDPLTSAPALPRSFVNPFRDVTHFDNNVPVTPILILLYLSVASAKSAQWQPVTATAGPDTFWAWLNAPSETDPRRNEATLAITNIAAFLYHRRPDLQQAFPDLFGHDRLPFARWFLDYGRAAYDLDPIVLPLAPGLGVTASQREDGTFAPWSEWLAAWQLADERSGIAYEASYEALRTYLEAVEQDRTNVRSYLDVVEEDRTHVRTYLDAVERDQTVLREYLEAVEQDGTNLRARLAAVEEDDRTVGRIFRGALNYVTDMERDRDALCTYIAAVEQDRTHVREYLSAIEQERANLRAHLAAVEQDGANVRQYLGTVEQDRTNLRAHLATVEEDDRAVRAYVTIIEEDRARVAASLENLQREYVRVSALATEREEALAVAQITTAAREASVREKDQEIAEWERTVETLQMQLEHAERFSRLYRRLRVVVVPMMNRLLRHVFATDPFRT